MEIIKFGSGKDILTWDPIGRHLDWKGFCFPQEGLLCCSENRPWQLKPFVFQEWKCSERQLTFQGTDEKYTCVLKLSVDPDGFLHGQISVTARRDICDFSCSVAFPVPASARLTMPMSLYNNNPSTSNDRVVPRFPTEGPASLVLEESRFPVPGVNAEFDGKSLSLFLFPGKSCSIGAERDPQGKTVCLLSSGCVAFNGSHDVVYKQKCRALREEKGYRKLQAGEVFSFDFALHYDFVSFRGQGFRDLVKAGWQLFAPQQPGDLSLEEVLRRKYQALDDRWHENGYWSVLPENLYQVPASYLYGWTGQGARLALCDIRRGVLTGEERCVARGLKAVRFFVENAATDIPGLYNLRYFPEENLWVPGENSQGVPVFSARALGETFSDMARIMLFCRENDISYPDSFENAVREGFSFMVTHLLPEGITPVFWKKDGLPGRSAVTSAGTSMLTGLLTMFRLTKEKVFLHQALELLACYWHLGGEYYETPFSHATLDSGCEDKEAAVPFFNAAAEAWRLTQKECYRQWAESSGDWLLTWVYFWDVPFPEDSICGTHHFKTTGWPAVSVENQHLDVFFPAWEMYRFGRESGHEIFEKAGKMVFNAWSQGISSGRGDWLMPGCGMQAEQFFQTDWCFPMGKRFEKFSGFFRKELEKYGYSAENVDLKNPNGGCNPWEVSWIISLVLDAALSFKEAHLRGVEQ